MSGSARRCFRAPMGGMALVAVLWIVGALSVLVTGIVHAQRTELRMASASRSTLLGEAAGQAAIHLVLQGMTGGAGNIQRLTRTRVTYGDRDIAVDVMPLTGLVDLNLASAPLLAGFLASVGGMPADQASEVAEALVARRRATEGAPEQSALLTVPEELLSVPGADYELFARIADFVTTDSRGSGRVNPLAAPEEVLSFLARQDRALARQIASQRDAGAVAIDTTRLEATFIDATVSSRYRFTAHVPMADGASVRVTRDVDTQADQAATSPWQTLRASARWMAQPRGPI